MDAALLGLAHEAAALVLGRAKMKPAQGYRFPVFAPHLQDYEPSADHFAVMANALTYMLLQSKDDADEGVLLLPACGRARGTCASSGTRRARPSSRAS